MKKIIYILLSLLFIFVAFILFLREPLDLPSELDILRAELEEKDESSFDYTHFYNLEDRIDTLIANGEFEKANIFIDSLLISPIDKEFKYSFYFRKGKILHLQSNHVEAIKFFNLAIDSTEKMDLECIFWRSFSFAKLGKCDEAIKDYDFINMHSEKYKKFEHKLNEICNKMEIEN